MQKQKRNWVIIVCCIVGLIFSYNVMFNSKIDINDEPVRTEQKESQNKTISKPNMADYQQLPGYGTTIKITQVGAQGEPAVKARDKVKVHATGTVIQTGKKFWSTKDPGQQPFEYQAGVGSVIVGWDQGVLNMQRGEVRQILIPANEGYGEKGFPAWGIPAGGILNFEIEVLTIN